MMPKGWLSPAPSPRSGVALPPYPTPPSHHRLLICRRVPSSPPPPNGKTNVFPPLNTRGLSITSVKTRRRLILFLFPLLGSPLPIGNAVEGRGEEEESLELYTDEKEGFALLRPSSWLKVDKAGATVLFEDVKGKGNSIGVVVNPVRLSSLRDFGTPQFVADKLIQAERRKESTKDAQVISFSERLGHEGLPVYEFEYAVDSTRGGMKRIFSAAFVNSKKLYLLNISYSDRPDNPLESQTRTTLEQVLGSFNTTV